MNLLALKNQIAGDLHRDDLSSQIAQAITDAITHYERERWSFLEGRATMTTINAQAWYAVPTDVLSFDNMIVTLSGARCPLNRTDYLSVDNYDTGQYTGVPTEWVYYADQIRLYPPPNSAYTITLSYHKKLSALTDDDSNAWTTDAKDLIRFRSEWDVYLNYLKAVDMAKIAKSAEGESYVSLKNITAMRATTGFLTKTKW